MHCLGGISRSATVAIAYIMQHMKMTSDDAYRYVVYCKQFYCNIRDFSCVLCWCCDIGGCSKFWKKKSKQKFRTTHMWRERALIFHFGNYDSCMNHTTVWIIWTINWMKNCICQAIFFNDHILDEESTLPILPLNKTVQSYEIIHI